MAKYAVGDAVIVTSADEAHHNLEVGSEGVVVSIFPWKENGEVIYDVRGTNRWDGEESLQLVVESGLTPVVAEHPTTV